MKKNRKNLFFGLMLFCLFGFIVSMIEFGFLEKLFYFSMSILFAYLWIQACGKNNVENPKPDNAKNDIGSIPASPLKQEPYTVETHHITGVAYHQEEIESLGYETADYDMTKKEIHDSGYENERLYEYDFSPKKVELIEEPENEYDPNAIKVIIDGVHVGYIKKGSCSHIKKLLHSGKIKELSANIGGGRYKILEVDDDDYASIHKESTNYWVEVEIKVEKDE